MMSRIFRAGTVLLVLALPLGLAACPGDYEGGYDKVSYRERTPIALVAAPDPPPVVAGFGGGGATTPNLPADAPAAVTQEMVEEGQRLFGTVCSACHGAGGSGSPAGPALQDQDWIHIGGSFEEIAAIIQAGVPNPQRYPAAMPPLGGGNFNAEQVRAMAAYIFALSHQAGA